ncbi:secreted protein [Candidatus Omnitrophus magneticus]|uniref:Secreted protein n=1 Tax=Candidatus Omnitrophus magneticus TaxID=1609969 RepID=A0A0F0CP16_9BACT|nr:secreted protein [Candidatus Omnitrophus magneticus]
MNKIKIFFCITNILLLTLVMTSCSDSKKIEGTIVFSSNRNGGFNSFILKNGKMKLLKSHSGVPVWSPDGERIACDKIGEKGDKQDGFYIFDKNGKDEKFIKTKYVTGMLVWRGNEIFHVMSGENSDDPTPNAIWRYDLKKEIDELVIKVNPDEWISYFALSNKGDKIMYEVSASKGFKYKGTFLYDRNTKETIKLEKLLNFSWYPNDDKYIFCTTHLEDEKYEIDKYWGHFTKYNLETGEKEYLGLVPGLNTSGFKISRDGKWLYYAGLKALYRAPLSDISKAERITEPVRTPYGELSQDRDPDWYM